MKILRSMTFSLSAVLLLILTTCFPLAALSADLYLTDITGQIGPAPPPAPYTTTMYLYMDDIPNAVSAFKFKIYHDPDIMGRWTFKLNDEMFKDWGDVSVGSISGSSGQYTYIDAWTIGDPIPQGTSGLIAEMTYKLKKNEDSLVILDDLEGDMESWSTQNAAFTCILTLDNHPPIADAGADQIGISSIILAGSGSTDREGYIVSWIWSLTHRSNHNNNRADRGEVIAINDLKPGFYDVTLTVTDDTDLEDTDSMLLAISEAPEPCIQDEEVPTEATPRASSNTSVDSIGLDDQAITPESKPADGTGSCFISTAAHRP